MIGREYYHFIYVPLTSIPWGDYNFTVSNVGHRMLLPNFAMAVTTFWRPIKVWWCLTRQQNLSRSNFCNFNFEQLLFLLLFDYGICWISETWHRQFCIHTIIVVHLRFKFIILNNLVLAMLNKSFSNCTVYNTNRLIFPLLFLENQ